MTSESDNRGQWGSKTGFVMAAAGSAVGLANIWAFPYRTGQNGGAAFVIVYLVCIFLICLPFLLAEITLGRYSQKNVMGAIRAIRPKSTWLGLGVLSIVASIFILSFYSVVAGWSVGFIFKTLVHSETPFTAFAPKPQIVLPLSALFIVFTVLVVYGGVKTGIERWSKMLMPLLILLMVGLILRGLMLPNALNGLEFYLKPDFSKLDGKVIMAAIGQAFFSLSLGIGGILTYGSYLSKKENIIRSGFYIAWFDTLIALLAGLMIFPALFAFGLEPNEGPPLVFMVLPEVFKQLPAGNVIGAGFFLMLSIAALTSTISMLEISVAYFVDEKRWRRKHIVWVVGMLAFMLGLPSALSQGAIPSLSDLPLFGGLSYLELMIFLWFDIFPPLGAILFSIFIGWVWGIDNAIGELQKGSQLLQRNVLGFPVKIATIWGFFIRYLCPLAIALIWFNAIFA
ncbi:sodium-dependent transporter [candidate division KSB1 bacterium]|nr:sodium-dependent transporter [candidate division KSB1 bacterium]NIR73457.1 sodium-dependent transporter [candidate division KSB1 bacterium]NIS27072.1 sodium-dependent transporter [candidate division KSB1 bacterium]NIT73916.1 sodium-dependent transporter [candidate division KSB1 bacterium]NIU27817.1 sodium-dependent transporter [candidate division KSB1 bacterium]